MPARSGGLPPRRAPKLDMNTTQKGAIVPAFSGKLPLHRAPQAARAEVGPSRLVLSGCPQQVTGEELLVLPPIPRDIFEELTTLFDDQ